jgi:16S rRNA (cytosine967-C5)-methyltransferase
VQDSAHDRPIALINVQRLAAQSLAAVLFGKSLTAQLEAVWTANPGLIAGERGAIQDICYGSLRHLGRLESVLNQLVAKPIEKPQIRSLLLAALYQLEYTGAAPYAVVHHAVECDEALCQRRAAHVSAQTKSCSCHRG